MSPPRTPTSIAVVIFKGAFVVPSYILSAVIPETVSVIGLTVTGYIVGDDAGPLISV